MKYFITIGDRVHEVDLVRRLGELIVTVNGEPMDLKYSEADRHGQVTLQHDDRSFGASIEGSDSEVSITLAGHSYQMQIEDEREHAAHVAERAASKGGGHNMVKDSDQHDKPKDQILNLSNEIDPTIME